MNACDPLSAPGFLICTACDEATISTIENKYGGIHCIVISHPHYYSTHVEWAEAFGCPVYLAAEDKQWLARKSERQGFLTETETSIEVEGVDTEVKAIKLGGHFPGSLVLLFDNHLLIADTLMTTLAGLGNWRANALGEPRDRPADMNSFSFMWSIPNMIPLSADEIASMWAILKHYDFSSTHGAFLGQDVEDANIKARVLRSMQIHIKHMGYAGGREHPLLSSSA
ncbi:hypothetical protein B0H63DRAFT_531507 [Podospora didyma]|uniref:Metallo-beta-lactamase domain-containing protein n=1 Tax=Podospora didyma TaxID=330526 RepID=A0AAE0P5H2_9PEZI|nr:hypothetical protein B0H63DRAFT_531507 [Podospora didyma]